MNYHLDLTKELCPELPAAIAHEVYRLVFRNDFSLPGFALLSLGARISSTELRHFMIRLKESLDVLYHSETNKRLSYLSMSRFDQQVTTKHHLDGAPEEAYLMLGYEPTTVASALYVADYSRAAFAWGITSKELLANRNPILPVHEEKLLPYVTEVDAFDFGQSQVLLLNNSSMPCTTDGRCSWGVMHKATILSPRPSERRIVNSTMIGSRSVDDVEVLSRVGETTFLETMDVAGEIVA